MLTHLSIHNLAIIEHLELHFHRGMTILTGETGAGKSILIDALGLVLGERADAELVRRDCKATEVSASFDLTNLKHVEAWLSNHALEANGECVLRRIVHADGRSRSSINGRIVPLVQLKTLGSKLIDIHGQHQHQTLLKTEYQRKILDEFAKHDSLTSETRTAFSEWQRVQKEFERIHKLRDQNHRLALLRYQIEELESLQLKPNELENLIQEQKTLQHVTEWRQYCEAARGLLVEGTESSEGNDQSVSVFMTQALKNIELIKAAASENHAQPASKNPLTNIVELLNQATIAIDEANLELKAFGETLQDNPERLQAIDDRLRQIFTLARKHKVAPEQLWDHINHLQKEAGMIGDIEYNLEVYSKKLTETRTRYLEAATALSMSRKQFASDLSQKIQTQICELDMPNAKFVIEVAEKEESAWSAQGIDDVEFFVTTNAGEPVKSMRKTASGGELSRISLAIRAICANKMTTPSLIFDEIDTGISGKTAEIVGTLMRTLSKNAQVLCVTHLPQIASLGHRHFKVEKHQTDKQTSTRVVDLNEKERIQEVARLLGGVQVTDQALAYAQQMLESVGV